MSKSTHQLDIQLLESTDTNTLNVLIAKKLSVLSFRYVPLLQNLATVKIVLDNASWQPVRC